MVFSRKDIFLDTHFAENVANANWKWNYDIYSFVDIVDFSET